MNEIHIYEPADYPREWTSEQRLQAYWFALKTNTTVENTESWYHVLARRDEAQRRRQQQPRPK